MRGLVERLGQLSSRSARWLESRDEQAADTSDGSLSSPSDWEKQIWIAQRAA